ncbi:hypothetical protein ATN37_00155 [Rhodococcus sp. MH15]|nr:hypothetical protein [Rhodococcus sp. MH15]
MSGQSIDARIEFAIGQAFVTVNQRNIHSALSRTDDIHQSRRGQIPTTGARSVVDLNSFNTIKKIDFSHQRR